MKKFQTSRTEDSDAVVRDRVLIPYDSVVSDSERPGPGFWTHAGHLALELLGFETLEGSVRRGAKRRAAAETKRQKALRQPEPAKALTGLTKKQLRLFRKFNPTLLEKTTHGSARFAWLTDMIDAGLVHPDVMLRDGEVGDTNGFPISAAHRFEASKLGWNLKRKVIASFVAPIGWAYEGHRLIVGSPGSGKLTSAIAPLLLNDDGCNAFVIDPKGGEAALVTSRFRAELGEVVVIDPCGVTGLPTAAVNPVGSLDPESESFARDAARLSEALIPEMPNNRDSVWTTRARDVLTALIIHVRTKKGPKASLLDVEGIALSGVDASVVEDMIESDAAGGYVQRQGMAISGLQKSDRTWESVKLQMDVALGFLNSPGVRRTLEATTFDVLGLKKSRMTVYVVVPNKEKATLGRWLRLLYASVMDQIDGIEGEQGLHVVVDEFAALGKFDRVINDLATLRGQNVQMHLVIQDLNQLRANYGAEFETVIGNCAVRQYLGVVDNFTAEYVSKALGQTTVMTDVDNVAQHSGNSTTYKLKKSFGARSLQTPAEVLRQNAAWQYVFTTRSEPLDVFKTPYFKIATYKNRAGCMKA